MSWTIWSAKKKKSPDVLNAVPEPPYRSKEHFEIGNTVSVPNPQTGETATGKIVEFYDATGQSIQTLEGAQSVHVQWTVDATVPVADIRHEYP